MRILLVSLLLPTILLTACSPDHATGTSPIMRRDSGHEDGPGEDGPRVDTAGADVTGADITGGDVTAADTLSLDLATTDLGTTDLGPLPADWSCADNFWGDSDCDCGCAVLDVDCPDGNSSGCQFNFCGTGRRPQASRNWLCEADPTYDAGTTDAWTAPDAYTPDAATTDAAIPGTPRGSSCSELTECQAGLVCIPSGTCQEPCAELHCANNANFCFSSSPDHECPGQEHPHCVEGEGSLQLCRDLNINFTNTMCDGSSVATHFFHTNYTIPEGCYKGGLTFVASRICISAVENTLLTTLGGDLRVITNDPAGYASTDSCDYFTYIELNNLSTVGGDLQVGDVSHYTDRSAMEVEFEALEFPNLKAVYGQFRYDDAVHATHINAPELELVGGFFVLSDLPAIETVYLPKLKVIEGSLRLDDMPSLTALVLTDLERIDGYVSITNVPCVDRAVLDRLATLATGPVITDSNSGNGTSCP